MVSRSDKGECLTRPREETSGVSRRNAVAVIGIDRYQTWQPLQNAVADAQGVVELFEQLGFKNVVRSLFNEDASSNAISALATDDLRILHPDDNLVLFYAGHGGMRTHVLGNQTVKTAYLIPFDASEKAATWIELDAWLRAVALLPARHILVVVDACHSGIALGSIIKWRDIGKANDEPLSTLRARRSRRIITSALEDQKVMDCGPVHGHSLFTGCLIEALTHGLRQDGDRVVTGSQLGLYIQQRVATFPNSQQTPDFGTFDFDDRGELLIPLTTEAAMVPSSPADAELIGKAQSLSSVERAPRRTLDLILDNPKVIDE